MDRPLPTSKPKSRPKGKATEVANWIARHPGIIGDAEWHALLLELAPVSENYLRKLLRGSGAPLAPIIEGVRQDSLASLEASLSALLHEYEAGAPAHRARIRKLVIVAKDHARWAAKKSDTKRAEKSEMMLWMLTWLENPPLFRDWVRLRKKAAGV